MPGIRVLDFRSFPILEYLHTYNTLGMGPKSKHTIYWCFTNMLSTEPKVVLFCFEYRVKAGLKLLILLLLCSGLKVVIYNITIILKYIYVLIVTCYVRSGVEFSICGVIPMVKKLPILRNFKFQSLELQMLNLW